MAAKALIQSDRGIATSLLEVVLVMTIIAVISGVALSSAMDKIEDARFSRATADAEQIGIAIHGFMNDTGYAPAFKSGDARGPEDAVFLVLESAGTEPAMGPSVSWPSDSALRDRLENQLLKNRPAGSGTPYPRMGEISYARFRGWNGPYAGTIPSSDPWDNKYLVNVQLLTPKGVKMAAGSLPLGTGQRFAVVVISAGPNRLLETNFAQVADSYVTGGDDIVFRIQ